MVVEQALKAVQARVAYDDSHMQTETLALFKSSPSTPFKEMGALDCIAFVHVVYMRGAALDLDVSWLPYHAPDQLLAFAQENNLARRANLEAVFADAAIKGLWSVTLKTEVPDDDFGINGTFPIWMELRDGKPHIGLLEGDVSTLPLTELHGFKQNVQRAGKGLKFVETDDGTTLELEIGADGKLRGAAHGTDNDGPFRISIAGEKRLDYANTR